MIPFIFQALDSSLLKLSPASVQGRTPQSTNPRGEQPRPPDAKLAPLGPSWCTSVQIVLRALRSPTGKKPASVVMEPFYFWRHKITCSAIWFGKFCFTNKSHPCYTLEFYEWQELSHSFNKGWEPPVRSLAPPRPNQLELLREPGVGLFCFLSYISFKWSQYVMGESYCFHHALSWISHYKAVLFVLLKKKLFPAGHKWHLNHSTSTFLCWISSIGSREGLASNCDDPPDLCLLSR
jgi:hypothetical protein